MAGQLLWTLPSAESDMGLREVEEWASLGTWEEFCDLRLQPVLRDEKYPSMK